MRWVLDAACQRYSSDSGGRKSGGCDFGDVADAIRRRPEADHYPLRWLIGEIQPGIFERELCRGNSELRKAPTMLGAPRMHELLWSKVLDLGGDLTGKWRGIERGDVVDCRVAGNEVAPKG